MLLIVQARCAAKAKITRQNGKLQDLKIGEKASLDRADLAGPQHVQTSHRQCKYASAARQTPQQNRRMLSKCILILRIWDHVPNNDVGLTNCHDDEREAPACEPLQWPLQIFTCYFSSRRMHLAFREHDPRAHNSRRAHEWRFDAPVPATRVRPVSVLSSCFCCCCCYDGGFSATSYNLVNRSATEGVGPRRRSSCEIASSKSAAIMKPARCCPAAATAQKARSQAVRHV